MNTKKKVIVNKLKSTIIPFFITQNKQKAGFPYNRKFGFLYIKKVKFANANLL